MGRSHNCRFGGDVFTACYMFICIGYWRATVMFAWPYGSCRGVFGSSTSLRVIDSLRRRRRHEPSTPLGSSIIRDLDNSLWNFKVDPLQGHTVFITCITCMFVTRQPLRLKTHNQIFCPRSTLWTCACLASSLTFVALVKVGWSQSLAVGPGLGKTQTDLFVFKIVLSYCCARHILDSRFKI